MDAGRRHKTLRSEEEGAIIPSTAGDMNFMFELAPLILQDPQGEAMMQSQVDAHMRRTGITAGNPELKNPNSWNGSEQTCQKFGLAGDIILYDNRKI